MKGREGASVTGRCLYEGKGRCHCDRRCLYEGKGRCQCDMKVSV